MPRWLAHRIQKTGKIRQPILGETFSGEDATPALIREAIQNSLDERAGTELVRIVIFVSGEAMALPTAKAQDWFGEAWAHLRADQKVGSGLGPIPHECRFVVIEDMGTTGLEGDVTLPPRASDDHNKWALFFRKEGASDKSQEKGGRWGVGKAVFPRSSEMRAFIAASVRQSDPTPRPLVMGQASLHSRTVAGVDYDPDLWFCRVGPEEFELPIDDVATFSALASDFKIARQTQPGLSVVIPYALKEITYKAVIEAVIREYFQPILHHRLVVTVRSGAGSSQVLDSTSLLQVAESALPQTDDRLETIRLAAWLRANPVPQVSTSPPVPGEPLKWSDDYLSPSDASVLQSSLCQSRPCAIRMVTRVVRRAGPDTLGSFTVVLKEASDNRRRRPLYVRSGLVIPEVKGQFITGYHALLVADEPPVSSMLGDAENPAHTDWQKNSSNFSQYAFRATQLGFVKDAPANLVSAIFRSDRDEDDHALEDLFVLWNPGHPMGHAGGRKPGTKPIPPPTPPAPSPTQFRIERVHGGFAVRPGSAALESGCILRIRVAYDTAQGDPFAQYSPLDFRLKHLSIERAGLHVLAQGDNEIQVEVDASAFSFVMSGFDPRRDLAVRVNRLESVQ